MASEPRTLPGLALNGFWPLGTSGWKDDLDSDLLKLSVLTQLTVDSFEAAEPGTPLGGEIVILTAGANVNDIAVYDEDHWEYITPLAGFRAWLKVPGATYLFDGTDWVQQSAAITNPYDLGGFFPGSPDAGQVVFRYLATRAVDFPVDLDGSQGLAGAAATGDTDFDVQVNGGSVGTMTFAASGAAATFAAPVEFALAAGDVLDIVAPGTPDATLADIAWTLAGTR